MPGSGPRPHETARAYLWRTPHQFVANQGPRLGPGVCACHRMPSDPVHLGDQLLDTYAYLSRVTAALNDLCMVSDDYPDEPGGMPATAGILISWHLDPSVWKRAWLGRCNAEMWCVEMDGETGWAVFGPDDTTARYQDTAPTPEQAQSRAEHALRAVYEATS